MTTLLHAGERPEGDPSDWEYELTRKDGYPLTATILGSIAVIVAVIFSPPPLIVLIVGFGAALLIWLLAFAVTIRHVGTAWRIGSFVTLLMVGLITALGVVGAARMAVRDDARAFAQIKLSPDLGATLPGGVKGPISRAGMVYFTALHASMTAEQGSFDRLGLRTLSDAESLKRNPALLGHCDTLKQGGEAAIATAVDARQRSFAQFQRALLAPEIDPEFRRGVARTQARGKAQNADAIARFAAIERSQLDHMVAQCAVLARRHWVSRGALFFFDDLADLKAFNAHAVALQQLERDAAALTREGNEQMMAAQMQIMHALP